jgi:hypothetical protein
LTELGFSRIYPLPSALADGELIGMIGFSHILFYFNKVGQQTLSWEVENRFPLGL